MRNTWMAMVAAAGVAACASGGSGGGDAKTRTAMTSLDVAAAEACMARELDRLGFTVLEGDERDGSLRAVRPRKEILGIPTSDDFDRIDGIVLGAQNDGQRSLRLTLGTFDGNEEESLSAEVKRDADVVLQACR